MIDDQVGAGDRRFWTDRQARGKRVLLKKHTFVPIDYPYAEDTDTDDRGDRTEAETFPPSSLHGLRARAKQLGCRPIGICRTVRDDGSAKPRIRISGTVCPVRRALYEEQMSMVIAQVAAQGDAANFSSVLAPLLGNVRDELLMQLDIHATLFYEAVKLGYRRWSTRKPTGTTTAAAAKTGQPPPPVDRLDRRAKSCMDMEHEDQEMLCAEETVSGEEDKTSCELMPYGRDTASWSTVVTAGEKEHHGSAFMADKIEHLERRRECVRRRLAEARRRLHRSMRHSFLKDREGVSVADDDEDDDDDGDDDELTRKKPVKSAYIRTMQLWKTAGMQRPLPTEEKCDFYRAVNRQMKMAVHGLTVERK